RNWAARNPSFCQLEPFYLARIRGVKVFSRTSLGRKRGGGRLSPRDRVLVLRAQLRRRHPVLPDLGRHVRIVVPPPPGMGRRLRCHDRACRFRNRRDAPLSEVGPAGSSTNRPLRRNRLNRPLRRTGPVSSARRRRYTFLRMAPDRTASLARSSPSSR